MNVVETRVSFLRAVWDTLSSIPRKIAARRAEKRQARFDRGFEFAMERLRSAISPEHLTDICTDLHNMTDTSSLYGDYDEFDAGIDQALRAYR